MRTRLKRFKLPALAAAAAALLLCSTVLASSAPAQPVKVAEITQQAGYTQLFVQLNDNTNLVANIGQTIDSSCNVPTVTMDTARMWLSLAQASVLSGRNVKIYYNHCVGWNWILGIDLGT